LKTFCRILLLFVVCLPVYAQKGQFLTVDDYRNKVFSEPVSWQTLWVSKAAREDLSQILGRQFAGLRLRYWGQGQRTAWIFEEIGKELPITVGISVGQGGIEDVTILEYRESCGGEVRYSFFTDQFKGVSLEDGDDRSLDSHIDGITGATLSVRALKKIARLALYCHEMTPFSKPQEDV